MLKKWLKVSLLAIVAVFMLAACGKSDEGKEGSSNDDKLHLIASFSIINDILNEVGGDLVEVHSLVPIGTDPHEYDPLPNDIKNATDADAMFYNGLHLEGGEDGWFFKLVHSVGKDESDVYEVMKGVEPKYITNTQTREEEVNPHAFLDPVVGIQMVENTRDALVKIDPKNKETYEKNAEKLLEELREIDKLYAEKIGEIPQEKRILVTSERAYQYMADRYGLQEGFIWDIDTEEQGTPEQIKSLVDFIRKHDVPVLFVETNVDKRPMETVSKETNVEIYSELYSDELGKQGEAGETFTKFLRYNIEKIYEGLSK